VSIDPQIASDASSKMIAYNCFEGLVRVDAEGKIVPAGADSWTVSPDDLVYTFSLRRDAKWYLTNTSKEEMSDTDAEKSRIPADFDERVTAKDYVFGLKRAVDPATNAADGKYLASIANAAEILAGKKQVSELGVEAVDDYTLKITLSQPDPNLLYYLTRLAAMPCNEQFFNACRGRYGLAMEYMLCNGAYIVYRWSPGSLIRLEKNSLYTGDAKAKNDRVWVYYVEDETTVASKIESGTYDAGYVSSYEAALFKEKDGFSMTARNDVLWGYWFNGNSKDFAIADLRIAFASAVDKSFLTAPEYVESKTDRVLQLQNPLNYR
jgi:oligopeptide transport system substrate-binding protein